MCFEFPRQMQCFPKLSVEGNPFLLNFKEQWASEHSLRNSAFATPQPDLAQFLWVTWEESDMNSYHLWNIYSALGTVLSTSGALTHLTFAIHLCDRFYYNSWRNWGKERWSSFSRLTQLVSRRAWRLIQEVYRRKPAVLITMSEEGKVVNYTVKKETRLWVVSTQWDIQRMYTWNVYSVINQRYPDKFNLKNRRKKHTKENILTEQFQCNQVIKSICKSEPTTLESSSPGYLGLRLAPGEWGWLSNQSIIISVCHAGLWDETKVVSEGGKEICCSVLKTYVKNVSVLR